MPGQEFGYVKWLTIDFDVGLMHDVIVDMTPGLFQELGSLDEGVLDISWQYI